MRTPIFYDNNDHPVFLGDKVYKGGKSRNPKTGEIEDNSKLIETLVMIEGKPQLQDQWGKIGNIDCVESMRCTDKSNWENSQGYPFRPFYPGYFLIPSND